ncbi:phage tail sheath C-terminal domain-containing protein [Desulfosporosinus sp. FKA]|uniref:phage tail sheath C-terminal domain-containing protein n=1 Tax=Desulfosporosinus sp. FKA TaxID=1969834 RepID=UPI000B49EC34|nr:phage tail sheath C-terminal domain-containing protein [Desulfosporosinus sp. FKA]
MQEPQYVVPRIDIIEEPQNTNQQPNVNLGRIGFVGTFSWGPVGVPIRGYSETMLEQTFQGYTAGLTGWLSLHGIYKQNSNADVTVIRVAGASAKAATLTCNDSTSKPSVIVTANYPGTKPISVSWQAGTASNTVKLIVIADNTSRTYDNLTLTNLNTVIDPNVNVTAATGAGALPAPISSTSLAGGDNGATTQDSDYVNGLNAFANVPIHIILAAQQSSPTVQAALLAIGANTNVANGLCFPILNMPNNQSAAITETAMATLQGLRGIMSSPWGAYDDLPGVTAASDGCFAGILSNIAAYESLSGQVVKGLSSLQISYTDDDVYALTEARVCPITIDPLSGNFVIRNGVNMFVMPTNVKSDDWSQVNVRREFDKLETEIYIGTQWAKSNTNPNLPKQLSTWIDEHLRKAKVDNGEITDYQPTTANRDTSNQRRVITAISVQPLFAADFIDNYIAQWSGAISK